MGNVFSSYSGKNDHIELYGYSILLFCLIFKNVFGFGMPMWIDKK